MRMMIGTEQKSDPRPAITNMSFVAREYFGDCDDEQDNEQVEGCNELIDDFGGDSFYISSSPTLLGFGMRDDGCEPLDCGEQELDDVLDYVEDVYDDSNDIILTDDQNLTHEENRRVADAVRDTLALQKFFRPRKEVEERKTEDERDAQKTMAEARELQAYLDERDTEDRLIRLIIERNEIKKYDTMGSLFKERLKASDLRSFNREIRRLLTKLAKLSENNEPEVVEKAVPLSRSLSDHGMNAPMRKSMRGNYFSQAQRCHSGVDSRRFRRGTTTGKMLGGHHSRRSYDNDGSRVEWKPVEVLFPVGNGHDLKIRVA